ncbi:hypothetical protein SO802_007089 [Lithocarpus litseifolius]|uniref:Uncharacterized protein n=1 Tax=Lithocarpus litseifolius TaxID=425828 RepID=A0AAW2DNI7_9ROSI
MHTITNCNHIEHSRVLYSNAEQQASPTQLQSILQACSGPSVLRQGRQVHAQVIVSGYTYSNNNGLLGAKLLGMYVLCGSFVDAKTLFYKLELRFTHLCYSMMQHGPKILTLYFQLLLIVEEAQILYRANLTSTQDLKQGPTVKLGQKPLTSFNIICF